MRTTSCVAYGLAGEISWLKMPRMPKAATSAVTARTSGTIEATNAPNVMSRMMKVRPIVMNVRSRPLLISSVMSWLVSVWLIEWTVNPWLSDSIAVIASRTGTRRPVDGRLIARDPPDDTGGRQVARHEPGRGRCRGRILDLAEDRDRRAVLADGQALEPGHDAGHEGLIRRVGDLEARVRDDDRHVLGRRVVPAGVEHRVGLRRLGLGLVRVAVRVVGLDAADRQAEHEQADRRDEPAGEHRPAMARAPHRDPDGRGLTGQVGRCVVGHWKPLRPQTATSGQVRSSTPR